MLIFSVFMEAPTFRYVFYPYTFIFYIIFFFYSQIISQTQIYFTIYFNISSYTRYFGDVKFMHFQWPFALYAGKYFSEGVKIYTVNVRGLTIHEVVIYTSIYLTCLVFFILDMSCFLFLFYTLFLTIFSTFRPHFSFKYYPQFFSILKHSRSIVKHHVQLFLLP